MLAGRYSHEPFNLSRHPIRSCNSNAQHLPRSTRFDGLSTRALTITSPKRTLTLLLIAPSADARVEADVCSPVPSIGCQPLPAQCRWISWMDQELKHCHSRDRTLSPSLQMESAAQVLDAKHLVVPISHPEVLRIAPVARSLSHQPLSLQGHRNGAQLSARNANFSPRLRGCGQLGI